MATAGPSQAAVSPTLSAFPGRQIDSGLSQIFSAGDLVHVAGKSPSASKENVRKDVEPQNAPILTWILGFLCALLILALIGLGVGLGIKLNQQSDTIAGLRMGNANANFNCSSYYGIPEWLPIADEKKLVNQKELDLDTGFVVSNQTTTRIYTFDITQALAAPDGFQKPMILINGQFPGPLIEANSGDIIRVVVNNHMSNWSTTIHWHGLDLKNSSWYDGVAGVSQCGIPPGKSFAYEIPTDGERGTYWYHSHLSTEYTEGLFGPIVIHDPEEAIQPVDDEKIIFMGDWYHTYGSVLANSYLNPTSAWSNESGVEALADNLLMNGRNRYNCSVQSSTFPPNTNTSACDGGSLFSTKVQSNKAYRLRLINHSTFFSFWFSIDNHTIEIVEIDGIEIEPIPFRGVNVNIGQRYSVVVRTNQTAGNYYMRASLPQTCFLPFVPYNSTGLDSTGYQVMGILSYDNTSVTTPTIGVAGDTTNPYYAEQNPFNSIKWEGCNDMPFDMPKPVRNESAYNPAPNNTHYIEYEFQQAQNVNRIFINKTSWAPLEDNATIWKLNEISTGASQPGGYDSFSSNLDQQVLTNPDASGAVQLVINSLDVMQHPWHLHGHDVQIVGWGQGLYGDGNTTWSYDNPMRRDTITIPAGWHVVLRWKNDNPGIWAMHCHVAWHVEGGMFLQFADRVVDLMGLVAGMDPGVRETSRSFCGVDDDQAFGTYTQYQPPVSQSGKIEAPVPARGSHASPLD